PAAQQPERDEEQRLEKEEAPDRRDRAAKARDHDGRNRHGADDGEEDDEDGLEQHALTALDIVAPGSSREPATAPSGGSHGSSVRSRSSGAGRHPPRPRSHPRYASAVMPTVPTSRSASDPADEILPADDPEILELDLRGLRSHWAAAAARPPMTAAAMTGADHKAQALGIPGERLMEHAGAAVAAAARALAVDTERWGRGPIVILC